MVTVLQASCHHARDMLDDLDSCSPAAHMTPWSEALAAQADCPTNQLRMPSRQP